MIEREELARQLGVPTKWVDIPPEIAPFMDRLRAENELLRTMAEAFMQEIKRLRGE